MLPVVFAAEDENSLTPCGAESVSTLLALLGVSVSNSNALDFVVDDI